jgi:hypothetical protein
MMELVAALLGALVGGFATLVGSVVVNRAQLRKAMRVRMYDEMLPKLFPDWAARRDQGLFGQPKLSDADGQEIPAQLIIEWLSELRRVAVIAAPKDAKRVQMLLRLAYASEELNRLLLQNDLEGEQRQFLEEERMARDLELWVFLQSFRQYLERKMHWRPRLRQGVRVKDIGTDTNPHLTDRLRGKKSLKL